jgi:hypothetical protein
MENDVEAAWVSFCRAVEKTCGGSMRYGMVDGDTDRCPADLTSVPVLISARDVIIMGLRSGVEVSHFSMKPLSLSMQGKFGSITSSMHPTLGPILHFAPRKIAIDPFYDDPLPLPVDRGVISERWMVRTWIRVASRRSNYKSLDRRTMRRLDKRWTEDNLEGGPGAIYHGFLLLQGRIDLKIRKKTTRLRKMRKMASLQKFSQQLYPPYQPLQDLFKMGPSVLNCTELLLLRMEKSEVKSKSQRKAPMVRSKRRPGQELHLKICSMVAMRPSLQGHRRLRLSLRSHKLRNMSLHTRKQLG